MNEWCHGINHAYYAGGTEFKSQWCSGSNLAYYAGGTEFKSNHKRYSFATVA